MGQRRSLIKTAVKGNGYIALLLFFYGIAIAGVIGYMSINETAAVFSEKKELPIYGVNTEEKKVAITFDAAWGNEDTGEILAILEKYDVKATFFMTGGWVSKYPDDVKSIYEAGHDLGNHSENHKQMSRLSHSECVEEVMGVHEKVAALTGENMCLFRPPYGDYNDMVIEACDSVGYYTIQWDVDSLDWKDYGADNIVKTVLQHKNLQNGSIILMHNGAKYTKDALERVIVGLREMGYELVPVSELIYTEDYELDHAGRQNAN